MNLYAYCANNPVYYVDPSGNYSNCMKEAYLEARKKGMSKEDAYAYAKKVYEQNHNALAKKQNQNVLARKQGQLNEKAQIESNLMNLVNKAQNGKLTKADYKQLRHYSRLLGAGDSLTFKDNRNPLLKAIENRNHANTVFSSLPPSQRGLTKGSKKRTVASNGTECAASGYSPTRMGKKHLKKFITVNINNIIRKARTAGYIMPQNSSKDGKNPGYEAATHAEKQMYSIGSNIIGVTLEMCPGCQEYFPHVSGYDKNNIYISDPSNQHIFTSTGFHFILK